MPNIRNPCCSERVKTQRNPIRSLIHVLPTQKPVPSPVITSTLTPADIDRVFSFQLVIKPTQILHPSSLYLARIAPSTNAARRVIAECRKAGVLLPHFPWVNTSKITSQFKQQVPQLSPMMMKRLLSLLIEWEEECKRLDILESEREDLEEVIAIFKELGDDYAQELETRVQEIEAIRATRPSARSNKNKKDEVYVVDDEGVECHSSDGMDVDMREEES